MDENHDDIAISMFKSGLPTEHGLRKSLTGKPVTSVRQLMDRIDKYKRVEEDQLQGKGNEKIIPPKGNDYRSERYNSNQPRRDFSRQAGQTNMQMVNAIFREPVQQVLEKVKKEPFFKWPETPRSATRTCIVIIIKTTGIPLRIAGIYEITWISWSEKESYVTFYTPPVVISAKQFKSLGKMYL